MKYFNITDEPFCLSGFPWINKNNNLCRLPVNALSMFSESIQTLAWHTSGGMVRFKTNSNNISLKVKLKECYLHPNMPMTALCGFDFYLGEGTDKRFYGSIFPQYDQWEIEEQIGDGLDKRWREWSIYLPIYCGIEDIKIGINEDAKVLPPSSFTVEKPIVFYGSSITQGACSSRPGNAYTHTVARWLDGNFIDLGFSGSAKGEEEMAELIASLDMELFVMDYDHNAPDQEHLLKTHEPFFKIIREKHPDMPVVFMTAPYYHYPMERNDYEDKDKRREIVYRTFKRAKEAGDGNVYFLDGYEFFQKSMADACTVDNIHPTDIGMFYMAKSLYPILYDILKNR